MPCGAVDLDGPLSFAVLPALVFDGHRDRFPRLHSNLRAAQRPQNARDQLFNRCAEFCCDSLKVLLEQRIPCSMLLSCFCSLSSLPDFFDYPGCGVFDFETDVRD